MKGKPYRIKMMIVLLCVVLFGLFIWKADAAKVWENIERLRTGFLVILAISAIRPAVRSAAWRLCLPRDHSLGWFSVLLAYVAGDSLGSITPLGPIASEPTKAALLGESVPLPAGISSLAIENILYSFTTSFFLICGTVALFLSVDIPLPLQFTCVAMLVSMNVFLCIVYVSLQRRWQVFSKGAEWLRDRGVARKKIDRRFDAIRSFEEMLFTSYSSLGWRFPIIMLLELTFHLAGIAEVYATLYFINSSPPTLLTAFILESANRIVNIAFKFVPLRAGVDEAGSGILTSLLLLDLSSGVTLALIRKGRVICWTALGASLLVLNRFSSKRGANGPLRLNKQLHQPSQRPGRPRGR